MTRTPLMALVSLTVGASVSCSRPVANATGPAVTACDCKRESVPEDVRVPTGSVRQLSDAGTLKLSISGEYFNSKRSRPLRVTLSNPSLEGVLWVNLGTRIVPDFVESPLHVRIRHATTGQVLTPDCTADFMPNNDYVELGPGGAHSELVSLGCVSFSGCGPWLIQATYQDAVKELPKPPPHVEWFSGTAESNTIEVMLDKLPYPPFERCPNNEPAQSKPTPDAGTVPEPPQ
jgi:hypothetical protein